MNRHAYLFFLIVVLLAAPLTAQNGQNTRPLPDALQKQLQEKIVAEQKETLHPITAEELLALKRVYAPAVSPDGKWVMYGVNTPDIENNRGNSDLYLVSLDGSVRKQLTTSPAADFGGVWSPDGKSIAFLSTRDGAPQIYVIALSGGEARKITDIEGGVSNLSWSPDGAHFAFTSDVKLDETIAEKYPDYDKAKVRIYDHIPVRHWDEWNDEKYRHLFVLPADGRGEARDLMEGERFETPLKPFGGAEQIAWSPDGKEIAYVSKKGPDYASSTNSEIYVVSIADGSTRNITEGMPGFDRDPLYSPDGRWIAFHSMARAGHEADRNRLMLYDRESGVVTELSKTLDQWVGATVWGPESAQLYFASEDGATVQVYRMDLDGDWEILTGGVYNHDAGLDITPDGETLVYGRRNFNAPTELYAQKAEKDARPVPLTGENAAKLSTLTQVRIEERWIPSTDGKKVQTWVVYPPDFDPEKKYPMITYCQGGPQATVSQFFSFAWNFMLMASEGYVVVAPNRRGLPGFGQEWNDAISQDWGGMPMQDILAATDALLAEPYIDRDHVTAIGASAGGYAVFWLAGNHEGRFSSFVSHCGVFNLESMYGATEELWFTNWENGGPYWDADARPNYDKHSPHRYAQNWDTPILIITGEYDFRVPYTQSLEAYTVAQVKGIPSKLIVYPDENHWVLHPQEQMIWFKEFFDFIGTHRKQ
mgnify:FL=1